ncbi:acyl-CoA dehydrogenase family protein [Rhodococcus erythropolis]|uniref:acyl-CoA dehydrogenase family protein n=1 Tax=Rhodococcus erythropolis TaxID=1833 RepID=UPI0009BBF5E9|nr:acyl-CoA dehydrogenase family protein [Rhodococcus erythropolis]
MTTTHAISDFRDRVSSFLVDEAPQVLLQHKEFRARGSAYRRALFDAGLAGLTIPQEFGGQGLPEECESAFAELALESTPPEDKLHHVGEHLILPILIEFGEHGLATEFGSALLSGTQIGCQLFSEPDAGSDLPGVRTRAAADGDGGWIISGQKVWTSYAQYADVGILLARTDPEMPKHHGLSMFVLDMHAPGVEVRPLRQMTGDAEFNEVFLDEVRIPGHRMIGSPGEGWKIATSVLGRERRMVSRSGTASSRRPLPVSELTRLAERHGRLGDASVRADLLEAWMGERAAALISSRISARTLAGHPPGPETSLGKLHRTRNGVRNARIAADLAFSAGANWSLSDTDTGALAREILDAPGLGIGGGTDEIQRNTIGERILGLPREPSLERGKSFNRLKNSESKDAQ